MIRDEEIVERHEHRGQKAGRIAKDLDVPVSRVWRVLAAFWRAEALTWRADAEAEAERARAEMENAALSGAWTLEQRKRLMRIVREPSLSRRIAWIEMPLNQDLPPAEVVDLRRNKEA